MSIKLEVIGYEWAGEGPASDLIITVKVRRYSLWPWFRYRLVNSENIQYRGCGTVWRELKTGKRASSFREFLLADAYAMAKWEKNK